jgi:7,8-dihydropterin-6-yl-methyl-4-(beta-D-ribofuranosyl)aminobenzene 5'-phosphate synthase
LHETYEVRRVAPGHCTGEPAFYRFKHTWKDRYIYAGLGSVVALP